MTDTLVALTLHPDAPYWLALLLWRARVALATVTL